MRRRSVVDFSYAALALISSTTRTHFLQILRRECNGACPGVFGILSRFIPRTVILYSFRFVRFFLTSKNISACRRTATRIISSRSGRSAANFIGPLLRHTNSNRYRGASGTILPAMRDSLLCDYRFPVIADHSGSSAPRSPYSGLSWFGSGKGRPLAYRVVKDP